MSDYNILKYNQKATPIPRMETCEINNRSLDITLSLTNLEPFLRGGQNLKKYLKITPILIYSKKSPISDLRIENIFFKGKLNNFTPNLNPNFLIQEELLPGMNYNFSSFFNNFNNLEEYKFIYFSNLNINELGRADSFVDPLTNQLNQKIEIKNKLLINDLSFIDSNFCSLLLYTILDAESYFRDTNTPSPLGVDNFSYSFINISKNNFPVGQGVYDIRNESIFPPLASALSPLFSRADDVLTDIDSATGFLQSLGNIKRENFAINTGVSNVSYSLSLNNKKLTSIFVINKNILCENNSNISSIFPHLTEATKQKIINDYFYLTNINIKDEKGNLIDSFYHEEQIFNNLSNLNNFKFYYFNDDNPISKKYYAHIEVQDNTQSIFQETLLNFEIILNLFESYYNKSNYSTLYNVVSSDLNFANNKQTIIDTLIEYYSLFNSNYIDQLTDNFERLLDYNVQKNNIEITFNFMLNLIKIIIDDLNKFIESIGFSQNNLTNAEKRAQIGSQIRRNRINSVNNRVENKIRKSINSKLFDLYLNNNEFTIDLLSKTPPNKSSLETNSLRILEATSLKDRFLFEMQKYFNINSLTELADLSNNTELNNTSFMSLAPSYVYSKEGTPLLNNLTSDYIQNWSPFNHAIVEIIILLDKFNFLPYYKSKKIINFYNESSASDRDEGQLGLLKIFLEYFIYMLGFNTISSDPISEEINSSLSSFNEESIINLVNSKFYLGESQNISEEDITLSRISTSQSEENISWNKNLFNSLTTNQYLIELVHLLSEKEFLSDFTLIMQQRRSLDDYSNLESDDLLPNQIKSLIKSDNGIKNSTTFDWNRRATRGDILFNFINYSIFKFNFDLVYNIEFLSGFNLEQPQSPVWALLTRSNLQDYLSSGDISRIICRFSKNTKNTKNYRNLNFNLLNQVFIIENPAELMT